MRAHLLPLLLVACGGTTNEPTDAASDVSASDVTLVDASKPDAQDARADVSEASIEDGGIDASEDASLDASDGSIDAAVDGGPVDGSVWDPTAIGGLALWLEGSTGVTKNNQNQVSAWADQSGNKNDATQNSANLQPVWASSVIGGKPALHFTKNSAGSLLAIKDASSLQWGTGDWTVEMVLRFTNKPNDGQITGFGSLYGKIGSSSGVFFLANDLANMSAGLSAAIDGNNLWTVQQSYNDNTARSVGVRRSGSSLELRVHGSAVTTQMQSGSVDVSASGAPVEIGKIASGNQSMLQLDGDIAEIVAVKGAISAQDLSALEGYFKGKYGL